ncbi:MAG: hypothetical protein [Olavius algarvensis Gamma 1 endosymbiont]|nr:MAG: hypothetical protein [Olavius algarvensis Gamma 1 endosymbiont]
MIADEPIYSITSKITTTQNSSTSYQKATRGNHESRESARMGSFYAYGNLRGDS